MLRIFRCRMPPEERIVALDTCLRNWPQGKQLIGAIPTELDRVQTMNL